MKGPGAIILANGAFPAVRQTIEIFEKAEKVICCDGAADACLAHGRIPDATVGDCDSISAKSCRRLGSGVFAERGQDDNDLSKAVKWCAANGIAPSFILGATGLREDHTIGNIFRLEEFDAIAPGIKIVTDYGFFAVARSYARFKTGDNIPVSVFPLHDGTFAKSTGLEWKLDGILLEPLWRATLNRTNRKTFSIETNKPVVVFAGCFPS